MSEEIAAADSLLAENAQLRARVLEWEECYDRLAGAFELHMDILECKQALADLAGSYYDVVLGQMHVEADRHLAELTLLRELAADVARWRETGGDPRDLGYILETADRYEARKAGRE